MRRVAKWMGILISVLFLSGSAWGYDLADHVKVAPNGKGDLMWFKYYVVANNGWETKISVTNTASVSVVAKVVIRSYKNSTELLDFMIYLSPYDVWTAKMYWDGAATRVYSEDSSCRNANGGWASAADPLDYPVKTIGTEEMPFCPDDSTTMGYIYVVQSAWSNANVTDGPDFGAPGVSKADIKKYYEMKYNGPFVVWNYGGEWWNNSLAGYQVFYNTFAGMWSSAVQAEVLRDYKSTTYLNLAETDRLGDWVSNNTLAEVEAAITKNEISLPYVSAADKSTVHIFTAPTKYTRNDNGSCNVSDFDYDGPFFNWHTRSDGRVVVADVTIWDVNENYSSSEHFSPSPTEGWRNEVTILAVPHDFPEGHVMYPFAGYLTVDENDKGVEMAYTGIPILTSVIFFGDFDSYGIDGAWSDGWVAEEFVGPQPLPFYQYADAYTVWKTE